MRQARLRGHVRKRSEGSGFRGFDDSSSRRRGVPREENYKRLIHEYGKVRACVRVSGYVLWVWVWRQHTGYKQHE